MQEYRKYIEKDQALERRFQPVKIEEPSIDDATAVIAGIRQYYEAYHHVKVSEAIVRSTVTLSEALLYHRPFPADKAIDLLDEACACNPCHPEITEWVENEKHLAGLKEQEAELWEQAKEGPDYEKLAQIKSEIIRLEAELPAQREAVDGIQVTMEDVAKVIELWTGIPAAKVKETEYTKLAHLEENLNRSHHQPSPRPCIWWQTLSNAAAQTSQRAAVRPALSSSAPRVWAKQSLSSSSRCSCSIRSTRLSVWICRNSWKTHIQPPDRFAAGLCGL